MTIGDDIDLTNYGDSFNINGGTLNAAGISATGGGAAFTVQNGGTIAISGNDIDNGSTYHVTDGSFTVGGTLTANNTTIAVSGGGSVQLAGLSGSDHLSVDGTSSLEIGTAGGAATGSITIDANVTVDRAAASRRPRLSKTARLWRPAT